MEIKKTGFLEESPGVKSSMRLMSMAMCITAPFFGYLTIMKESDPLVFFGCLVAAFAPKTISKFAEQKIK